jgi:hypothetical protein
MLAHEGNLTPAALSVKNWFRRPAKIDKKLVILLISIRLSEFSLAMGRAVMTTGGAETG